MKSFVLVLLALILSTASVTAATLLFVLREHLNQEPTMWLIGGLVISSSFGGAALIRWALDPD